MNSHFLNDGATYLLVIGFLTLIIWMFVKNQVYRILISAFLLCSGFGVALMALSDPEKTRETVIVTSTVLVMLIMNVIITSKLPKLTKLAIICSIVFGAVLLTISMVMSISA